MWTRAELKERAKACLRKYYWAAFAVSLVFSLISGIGSPVTQPADSGYQDDYYEEYGFVEGLGDDLPAVVGKIPAARVCHFLRHIEIKISLFCKVFLAFFTFL